MMFYDSCEKQLKNDTKMITSLKHPSGGIVAEASLGGNQYGCMGSALPAHPKIWKTWKQYVHIVFCNVVHGLFTVQMYETSQIDFCLHVSQDELCIIPLVAPMGNCTNMQLARA